MTGARILVVDDEPGITSLCQRLLTRSGFEVFSFNDPTSVPDFLKNESIDLLLADIRMPKVSGFELITTVQKYQPDMAILIMTGFGTVETAIQALRQGVDGLILKPFEKAEELVSAVHQALADSQKKRDVARIQALRPLFDITESLLAETRPDKLLELVINAVCGHLRCTHAAFYENNEADLLTPVAHRGTVFPEGPSGIQEGLIGRTDALSAPLWVNAEGPENTDLQPQIAKLHLGTAMTVPINRQKVRGVLFAARSEGSTYFREVDLEMFILLARQAAIAMENASLYEELRVYVRRVEESQQALLRAEKLAAAGRLTASIAHEINNPLQAVQNCLHLTQRKDLDQDKRKEYLDLAKSELDRLMTTVQRMLDFYRPGKVAPQRVDIADLIHHVLKLVMPQLNERNIVVKTDLSLKMPLILAVSNQIEQVLINIILNAYDVMSDGGTLHISTLPVNDMVEIRIHDTGPGVPLEERSRIFDPFVSTKQNGIGLGLSVSYGIIAAHGGSLDLIDDTEPGACFRILLPVKGEL